MQSFTRNKEFDQLCPICGEYILDCVKSGEWQRDEICVVCIERKALRDSSQNRTSLKDWKKMKKTYVHIDSEEYELLALRCIVDQIKKESRKNES